MSTETTAKSALESAPFTTASAVVLSLNVTLTFASFPSITWLLVAINTSESFSPIIIPEPLPELSCWYCLPNQSLCVVVLVISIATIEGITFSTTSDTPPELTEVCDAIYPDVLFCSSFSVVSSPVNVVSSVIAALSSAFCKK